MVANGTSGISDTGVTMRAFLPIDVQNRSSLHVYNGPSTVVDARVVCVRPNITDIGTYEAKTAYVQVKAPPVVYGNVSIPLDLLEKAAASRVQPMEWTKFNCSISNGIAPGSSKYHRSDWDLSVCQFDRVGGYLRNAWMTLDDPPKEDLSNYMPFQTYLLMRYSGTATFSEDDYGEVSYPMIRDVFDDSAPDLVRRNRGDWTEVYRTSYDPSAGGSMLSFSLCFPASAARYLNISAYSAVPIVEPRYKYDAHTQRIRFDDVRRQMLPSPDIAMGQRGIPSLKGQHWRGGRGDQTPYLGTQDTETVFEIPRVDNARTMHLVQYSPYDATGHADISVGGLLLEILREGGSTAQAVQSMMTVLFASRYQDYIFLEGGNATYASRANFVAVQIPRGQEGRPAYNAAGATRSYVVIMVAILVHVLIVCFVVVWFCRGMSTCLSIYPLTLLTRTVTNATYLWESWSSISQVLSIKTLDYVERAIYAKDSEVSAWIRNDGSHKTPMVVGVPRKDQDAAWGEERLRARSSFVERNESEQGLMMDDLRPAQASKRAPNHSVRPTRASSFLSNTALATGHDLVDLDHRQ
jgi:hypothetical protein